MIFYVRAFNRCSLIPSQRRYLFSLKKPISSFITRTRLIKDDHMVQLVTSSTVFTVKAIIAMSVLGSLGVDMRPVITGLGITGFTVGFALKDIGANFVSGFLLLFQKPFKMNDVIKSGSYQGKVIGMDVKYVHLQTPEGRILLPILLYCLKIGLSYIFFYEFLPEKQSLNGYSTFADESEPNHPKPIFSRLVFIIIDSLRADFVMGNNSGFNFVKRKIESGDALPFVSLAKPPTVTMPRIKALVSGSNPTFLDLVKNFDAYKMTFDNWLHQFKQANKSIVFYGDDTWIKMFGDGFFKRSEGTTSFFVQDTVEVDKNVTRHLDIELKNKDWDVMILHYLGLDHICHSEGIHSAKMIPKHQEMDKIIERIYGDLQDERTLLVVSGDHGITDQGNHGGSSIEELSTGLIFLSPLFHKLGQNRDGRNNLLGQRKDLKTFLESIESNIKYEIVNQIDIVSTLCILFGLPIPRNNAGKIIPRILSMYDDTDKRKALELNLNQISNLINASLECNSCPSECCELQEEIKNCNNEKKIDKVLDILIKASHFVSESSNEGSTNH
ncbi:Alkaline-phosphatase-like domain-containing protein [Rozella allomycis CSF55]|uniref:GPI ethanolamine phosphate transferase 2 n=2 Tax=Rozella allomycis (strain CSF55) TaxID=988480 RepID=A0A075ANT6_ROZAC|nr:Alkaline-phosphatase-like domain-containing protein [Rozella allomycis CSF55]|eukprot:EPZ31600.1 Alkaline-phosphatase-like domain-containing protein [Rozella allomycis CSF55]